MNNLSISDNAAGSSAAISRNDISDIWLHTIEEATKCLRRGQRPYNSFRDSNNNNNNSFRDRKNSKQHNSDDNEYLTSLYAALEYMNTLEDALHRYCNKKKKNDNNNGNNNNSNNNKQDVAVSSSVALQNGDGKKETEDVNLPDYSLVITTSSSGIISKWDLPPKKLPPTSKYYATAAAAAVAAAATITTTTSTNGNNNYNYNNNYYNSSSNTGIPQYDSNNPFAGLQYNNTYSSSSEDEDEPDDGGDVPAIAWPAAVTTTMTDHTNVTNIITNDNNQNNNNHMNCRRLLIRILTNISEIYAAIGFYQYKVLHEWMNGSNQISYSLPKLHQALYIADSQVSTYFQYNATTTNKTDNVTKFLMEDADVIHIAAVTLTTLQDRYMNAAMKKQEKLLRILQPQWKARDNVKSSWGDNWYNNPKPKNNYANIRANAEKELHDIQNALNLLEQNNTINNIHELFKSSQQMKHKLLNII